MKNIRQILFLACVLAASLLSATTSSASNDTHAADTEFKPGEMIQHHITDAPDWHLFTIDGHHYSIPLPVILYSKERGLDIFSSSRFEHGTKDYNGYRLSHGHISAVNAAGEEDHSVHIYNVSITKNVASMMISAVLLLTVFLSVAKGYSKRKGQAPSGIQSFFEPIIIYIRDDVAKTMIGPKYERFMPYLLTIFFFIWFNNLLGLIPSGANLTGNITITLFLALATFIITTVNGNKHYWMHILWTPGVPLPLRVIMLPLELIGIITKPFSLMVRLFANITAGHIIVLSFLGLIFIFKSVFASALGVPFALFISMLELFVALLQAYVFTLLSAMYFGSAVQDHHDDEHAHEAAAH
jgi:F-type H+-transporting ATPase subunit a